MHKFVVATMFLGALVVAACVVACVVGLTLAWTVYYLTHGSIVAGAIIWLPKYLVSCASVASLYIIARDTLCP